MTSHQRVEADAHAFLQVTGRSVRPTRELRFPRLRPTGLSLDKTFNGAVYWATGLSLDKTHSGPFTEVYRLVDDETPSFARSERCPTRAFLTLGATNLYLYKLCLSRFGGRHNLAHAGTFLKCTRVLDLENSALY